MNPEYKKESDELIKETMKKYEELSEKYRKKYEKTGWKNMGLFTDHERDNEEKIIHEEFSEKLKALKEKYKNGESDNV